jgi:hypothetical protein
MQPQRIFGAVFIDGILTILVAGCMLYINNKRVFTNAIFKG